MTFDEFWESLDSLPRHRVDLARKVWNAGRAALANQVIEQLPHHKGGEVDREIQRALESEA